MLKNKIKLQGGKKKEILALIFHKQMEEMYILTAKRDQMNRRGDYKRGIINIISHVTVFFSKWISSHVCYSII